VYAWLSQAQVDDFDEFELYWLGQEFDGLELYATVRQVEPTVAGEPAGRDSVDFLYGDCDARDGGCPFPLEVQVWPACRRYRALYELGGEAYPYEELRLRGVPAALFDGGTRLELYTGAVTVVLFGDGPARVREAAQHLRGTVGGPTAGDPLPLPVEGALEGTITCGGP
jgi:hypothetical protein